MNLTDDKIHSGSIVLYGMQNKVCIRMVYGLGLCCGIKKIDFL